MALQAKENEKTSEGGGVRRGRREVARGEGGGGGAI